MSKDHFDQDNEQDRHEFDATPALQDDDEFNEVVCATLHDCTDEFIRPTEPGSTRRRLRALRASGASATAVARVRVAEIASRLAPGTITLGSLRRTLEEKMRNRPRSDKADVVGGD